MMRWDIINHLIKKNNYKTYLELGLYKSWCFDRIECEKKDGVDPNPSKNIEEESLKRGALLSYQHGDNIWKQTTDEFFRDIPLEWKWDIIFIDADHHSEQVDKDIQNSLSHLSVGGTIVLHDCNPPTELHATTGVPETGEWCGDVYKSFIKFRKENWTTWLCYVVDTDYGVGVLKLREKPLTKEEVIIWGLPKWEMDTWDKFNVQRKRSLDLMSIERFLEYEAIETNNLPA